MASRRFSHLRPKLPETLRACHVAVTFRGQVVPTGAFWCAPKRFFAMLAESEMIKESAELKLPWNLGEWASPEQLSAWAAAVAGSLDWNSPELVLWLRGRPDFHPKAILSILTLAYALGIYE